MAWRSTKIYRIDQTLQQVIDNGEDYLDADVAAEAIAAAEVVAKAMGRGTQSDVYTEKVDVWPGTILAKPKLELLIKARQHCCASLARSLSCASCGRRVMTLVSGKTQSNRYGRQLLPDNI
jgi:hypothetical protein